MLDHQNHRTLRDGTNALIVQLTDLFAHIGSTNKLQRSTETREALLDTLVKHGKDIFDNTIVQEHLFQCIVSLATQHSGGGVEKAMQSVEAVMDANVMDPNAKRMQCTSVCTKILEEEGLHHDEKSCALVVACIKSLIDESSFEAPDVMLNAFECATQMLKQSRVDKRAAGFQMITTIVADYATQLKTMKAVTDGLRGLSPSYLVRETVNTEDPWLRSWTSKLLIELLRHAVFELKPENAEALVREVESQLVNAEGAESIIMGVLTLVMDFSTWKPLSQAFSWNPNKWRQFLFETEWTTYGHAAHRLAILTTVAITNVRISDIADDARTALCNHLASDFGAAAGALKTLLVLQNETSPAGRVEVLRFVLKALTDPLTPDAPIAETVRELMQILVVPGSPTALEAEETWSCVVDLVKSDRYVLAASVLEAAPSVVNESTRSVLLGEELIAWSRTPCEHMEGFIRLASLLHNVAFLPNILASLHVDAKSLRLVAARAALRMCETIILSRVPQPGEGSSRRLENVVSNAVEQLLDIAVADMDSDVRHTILSGLTTQFDAYLSLPDNLESIFMARYDVHVETQNVALILLCRVLPSHPAFVHPPLFRFQEYALKDVEARDSTVAESIAATIVLRTCAENRALLLQPKQVEVAVLERITKNPFACRSLTWEFLRLIQSILDISGPLNHVDGATFVHALTPIINEGHTSALRSAGLEALAAVVRTVGIPLETQLFADVYTMCGRIVVNDAKEDDEPRKSAVLVLSVLGAMNPVRIRAVTRVFDSEMSHAEETSSNDTFQAKPHPRSHPHMAERFPSIVLYLLVKTMQSASDPKQQQDALRCAYDTLQGSPANQKSNLMAQLVPQLRRWLADPDKANLYEFILKILIDLSGLLHQFKDTLPAHLGTDILKSLQAFCQHPQASQQPLNVLVVELLDELARAVPVQDIRDHRWAIDFIHQRLLRDKSDVALVLRVVKALDAFSTFLHEKDKRHVLPHILECLDVPPVPCGLNPTEAVATSPAVTAVRQVNAACFDFITILIQRHTALVKDFSAQIVHALMSLVDTASEDEDRVAALSSLAGLIATLGRPAQRFIAPIQRLCDSKHMASDVFKQMVQVIASGAQKVKLPPARQDVISVDLPLTLVSHLPALSRADFEQEIRASLKMDERDVEVLSVSHPGGQTEIHFRFVSQQAAESKLQLFMRKAADAQSTLKRNLGILNVEQRKQQSFRISADVIAQLSMLPETKAKRKKEFTWINWMQSVCLSMLRASPYQPFRVLATLHPSNMWLVKEVFPFATGAVLSQVDAQQRASFMQLFSQVIVKAPNDIRQILFSLAEFLESERGEKKAVVSKVSKTVTCIVERDAADQKFGINYDQDARGIIVTKLAPDGPGFRAGVPVHGVLLSINGQKVHSVNEIPAMIRGLTKIHLDFSVMEEVRRVPETKPLMDLADVARAAAESDYHAKAVYFSEVLLDQLCKNLGEGKKRKDAEAQQILQVVEGLMKCYNRLGLPMEAKGVAKIIAVKFTENIVAPEQFGFDEAGTLEQLQWWPDALRLYRSKVGDIGDGSFNVSSLLGMLRCYEAMGDPEMVRRTVDQVWAALDDEGRAAVAPFRASAALTMGDWDLFDDAAAIRPEQLGTIERAAYMFRNNSNEALLKFIRDERDLRFDDFCETFDDSYIRCIDLLSELQHLNHLEEVVQYQNTASDERRAMLRTLWRKRAMQVSRQPHIWRSMVTINSLVLSQEEDLLNRVECVNVCSKQGWTSYAEHILDGLMGMGGPVTALQLTATDPHIVHAYLKFLSNSNRRSEAHSTMKEVLETVRVLPTDGHAEVWGKCWFLLGEWTVQLNSADVPMAITALHKATELSPKNSSAFHSLGILHYERSRDTSVPSEQRHESCVAAVNALINSVQLSSDGKNSVMQDMLRILAIWFSHGSVPIVNEAVQNGMSVIPDHVWLRVIPQLIARMGINSNRAREMLTELLVRVGSRYPHSFIYPLTVSERSAEIVRRRMAEKVLGGIRQSCDQLVKEASLISNELVRIAILSSERWHAHIQLAAHKQDDAVEILRILQPLFEELEHPETPNERTFEKSFGQTLKRAKTYLMSKALDQAWQLLKQVYSNVTKQLSERKLLMSDVSPVLDGVRKSIVAVPGTFDPTKPLISIHRFQGKIVVMSSKQKPRRFGLEGSDGKTYRFLLKGHEDLRQDERVMQFLDLINTIFAGDSASTTLELFVPRYAVIPLTDNVGLIGWVENTETIYRMLETRRQEYNISVYDEVNLIIQKGSLRQIDDYHKLSKADRKHLLSIAIHNTPSDELNRIVWDKSDSCEQWLEYRRLYAHTLAIMSMVGYVLGLGDRHLNNLMLQQGGAVVHIDFGDCFEVAMHRAMYAEAVPFRLTRILVNALGVTGVDGVYRHTCEHVMKLLRRHKENLLSILEAFIYDPLINWKLNATTPGQAQPAAGHHHHHAAAGGDVDATVPAIIADAEPAGPKQPALSCTVRTRLALGKSVMDYDGEQELRNQQGDAALLRVHAKLSGQDFGGQGSATGGASSTANTPTASGSASALERHAIGDFFSESVKDSVAGPLLATYLASQQVTPGVHVLDVGQQVERLIQEATSLDNLAEAYITGWAPFW